MNSLNNAAIVAGLILSILSVLGFVAGTFYRMGRYGYIIEKFDRWMNEMNIWRATLGGYFADREYTEKKLDKLDERITNLERKE